MAPLMCVTLRARRRATEQPNEWRRFIRSIAFTAHDQGDSIMDLRGSR
jgi:hypothetical protein